VTPFVLVTDAGADRIRLQPYDPTSTGDGDALPEPRVVTVADFAPTAADLEREHPRWVWDDTARWYPRLLAAGVRVERCVDLRLCHLILRASSLTAHSALATAPAGRWDAMPHPSAVTPQGLPTDSAGRFQRSEHTALFEVDELGAPPAAPGLSAPASPAGAPAANALAASAPTAGAPALSAPAPAADALAAGALAADAPAADAPDAGASGATRSGSSSQAAPRPNPSAAETPLLEPPELPELPELTEWLLQRDAVATADDPSRIALLLAAESAGALVAAEMQYVGIPWDARRHDEILNDLLGPRPAVPGARPAQLEALLARIRTHLGDPTANPDSPAELLKSLRRAGITAESTRSWELRNIDHPAIPDLLDYKKRSRILTANGWSWLDTWVRDGRFHPTYLPGGVVTGRWASEGGGALQLPKAVRGAVRADPGKILVVADAAQLEPRILAALAGDRAMAAAGQGRDLYDGMVASGAVDTRAHAKLGMLGAMYGGTTGESGRMLPRLARAYPAAIAYVEAAARSGEAGATVSTRLGRTSPRPGDAWLDVQDAAGSDEATDAARSRARSAARSWGRFTRNFVVQGTAAEWALCWIGSIRRRLWQLGLDAHSDADAPLADRPHLAFFLHDEVMVHTPLDLAEQVGDEIRAAAVEAGRLIFGDAPVQFPVTVATVASYDQAK